jgi:hypothetical protein
VTAFGAVAAVIAVFFGFGIFMGALMVVALPAFRRHREERRRVRDNRRRYMEGRVWRGPPPGGGNDRRPPGWPGG